MANRRRIKMRNLKRQVQPLKLRFERLESRRLLTGINVSIYLDHNQNGIFDPTGDTPAANRIVYVDLNDNGRFDDGEPLAFSDDHGWAVFEGLEQGDYRVRLLADESFQRIIDPFAVDSFAAHKLGAGHRWVIEGVDGVWGLTPSGTLTFLDSISPELLGDRPPEALMRTQDLGGQPTSLVQLSESEAWIVYQTDSQTRLAIFDSGTSGIDHFLLATDTSYRIDQLVGSSSVGVFALTESIAGKQIQKLTRNGQEIVTQDLWLGALDYVAFLEERQVFVGARGQDSNSVVEVFSPSGQVIDSIIMPGSVEALVSDAVSSRFSVATDVTTLVLAVNDDFSLTQLAILAEAAAPIAMHSNRFVSADRGRLGEITVWNSSQWTAVNRFVLSDGPVTQIALVDQAGRVVASTEESLHVAHIHNTADQGILVTTRSDGAVNVRFGLQRIGEPRPLRFDRLNTRLTSQNSPDFVDLRAMLSQYSSSQMWFELTGQPANGSVGLSPAGQLTYTPKSGFTGLDPVVVTVYDGLQRAELTILWQVAAAAQPPLEIMVEVPAFSENIPAGSQLGYVTVVSPNPGASYRVITSDPRFRVEYGRLFLDGVVDFEQESTIDLELIAVDDQSQLSISTVTVLEVLNVVEPPSGIVLISNPVDENASSDLLGRLIVLDPDAEGDYEITVSDPRFTVIDDQLWLTEYLSHDTEGEVHLIVTVTDRNQPELFAESSIVVTVLPRREVTPVLKLSSLDVPESTPGAIVGSLIVQDLGTGALSYTVSDPRFEVVDGVLRLSENSVLDRQAESTVAISITVSNLSGVSATAVFPLTVIAPRSPWQNPINHADVNGDGRVSALDVLMVINYLNQYGSGPVLLPQGSGGQGGNVGADGEPPPYFPDVNGDGRITPMDALIIINELNAAAADSGSTQDNEGEGPPSVDEAISDEADSSSGTLKPEGEASLSSFDSLMLSPSSLDDLEIKRRENARMDAELEVLLEQLARQRI